MPSLITFDEALAYGAPHRPRGDRRPGRARLGGAPGELRRLDRHVLAGQRQVRRLRRGLRLLRPVALRRGRHADARDDGARADPRARRRRPRRPAPTASAWSPRARASPSGTSQKILEGARLVAEQTNLKRCASIGHMSAERAKALKEAGRPARPPQRRVGRAPTTPRSRPRSATRAACGRSRRSRRRGWRPASAASSTSARRREQRVEMAFELSEINPTSVPINLLNPTRGDQVRRPRADGPLGGRASGSRSSA